MPRFWRRDDIQLGMVVTRGNLKDDSDPRLYRVIAIADQPTVIIERIYSDEKERETFVIGSPLFAEFHQVKAAAEPGDFSIVYPESP